MLQCIFRVKTNSYLRASSVPSLGSTKRDRQLILLLCKTVTSYTAACIVSYEKQTTLREASTELHPPDAPPPTPCGDRVDPAPCFMALRNDETLKLLRLSLEIGRVKNPNKNPVDEKAILELAEELLKQEPTSDLVSKLSLVIAVASLKFLHSLFRSVG